MAIIVIGGQASAVGKTGVVCALIAAMPERRWTAIKVTHCSHEAPNAKPCGCELNGHVFAVSEEHSAANGTDSSRYLAAGAERSLWVRVRPGHLAAAMPRIHDEVMRADFSILESNSVLEFLDPDLYALILSPDRSDFKLSAVRYLDRADAVLLSASQAVDTPARTGAVRDCIERIPRFALAPKSGVPSEFLALVAEKLDGAAAR
jgi:hypothetical protein